MAQASRLRALLYVALVVSAGVALFGHRDIQDRISAGTLEPAWRFVPGIVFGVALLLYAADRVLLVMRARMASGRAFYQVAFGLVLLAMHFQGAWTDYRRVGPGTRGADQLESLMHHADPRVRALSAEVAGHRGARQHAAALVTLAGDANPAVRDAALEALERMTGQKFGRDASAAAAWHAWLERADAAPAQAAPAATPSSTTTTTTTTDGGGAP